MPFVHNVIYYFIIPVKIYVNPAVFFPPVADIGVMQRTYMVVNYFPMRLFHDMILVEHRDETARVGNRAVNVAVFTLFMQRPFHLRNFKAAAEKFVCGIKKGWFLILRNGAIGGQDQEDAVNKFAYMHRDSIDMPCFMYILQQRRKYKAN